MIRTLFSPCLRLCTGLSVWSWILCASLFVSAICPAQPKEPTEQPVHNDPRNLDKLETLPPPALLSSTESVDLSQIPLPKIDLPQLDEPSQVKLDKALEWLRGVEDAAPMRGKEKNAYEHAAYNYVLDFVRQIPDPVLRRQSQKNVPFANFVEEIRQDYQFELIHFIGRVVRIDEMRATDMLAQTSPIKKLYEVWLFPLERIHEEHPVCLVVSELPEGIKPSREIRLFIRFDAYYFKLLKYESGQKLENGKYQWRVSPVFLGKTFEVIAEPVSDAFSFQGTFVPAVVGLIVTVLVSATAISIYFRRGDREVKSRLATQQYKNNPFDSPGNEGKIQPGNDWLQSER